MILIATFLFSTAAYAKEDVGKEYDLDFLVKVGQQYIDGFYESDRIANNEDYIVTDTSRAVYSIERDIMAYILEIENKDGNEIGYVMVGSNETSPVILEASIEESLISNLDEVGKKERVIYIAPLKLAFANNGKLKNDKEYIDVRTKESFNFEFVESKSKISKEEIQEKNKKQWELIENNVTNDISEMSKVSSLARTYQSPTIYQIDNEANFVKIQDSSNSSKYYYGGNQS